MKIFTQEFIDTINNLEKTDPAEIFEEFENVELALDVAELILEKYKDYLVVERFEKDFNEAETSEKGIIQAFDNVPNDFFDEKN